MLIYAIYKHLDEPKSYLCHKGPPPFLSAKITNGLVPLKTAETVRKKWIECNEIRHTYIVLFEAINF